MQSTTENRISGRTLRAGAAVLLPLALALAGCGGSDSGGGGTSTTLTVTPSLGKVLNANVIVKNSAGAVVGSGTTGSNGVATITASGTGPFTIEVSPSTSGTPSTYFDENGTGAFLPLTTTIHALVPAGTTNVGVTPLTELAHSLFVGNSAVMSNTNINLANNAIRDAFASSTALPDILTPPTVVSGTSPTLGTTTGDVYAAVLAGLAQMGTGAAPALATLDQLRRDVSDGVLDAQEGSTAITSPLYTAANFATTFRTAIDNRVTSWGSGATSLATTLTTNLTISALTEPTWATGTTGGGGTNGVTTPATVNAALYGAYTLRFHKATGVSAADAFLVDNTQYQVSVNSDGTLSLLGRTYANPFYRSYGGTPNQHEVIWLADSVHIEYALTDNVTPTFNEINVGDSAHPDTNGIPRYLGQLRLDPPTPTVTGFTPASGAVGSQVTITGSGFGTDTTHITVNFFSGVPATIVSMTNTQIVVTVPTGAATGVLHVVNSVTSADAASSTNFTVTAGGGGGGGTWTSHASPTGFILQGIAYGNGTYVAVGTGPKIYTSANGTSWTQRTPPGDTTKWSEAMSVIYDGTQFVLVGNTTAMDGSFNVTVPAMIATSSDGVVWASHTWPTVNEFKLADVAAGGGKLTVVGTNGYMAYSTNGGSTWTGETHGTSVSTFTGVATNTTGNVRVAVGRNSFYQGMILVDSGTGWSAAVSASTDFYPYDVVYTGEQFVAVGGVNSNMGANPVVMTSQNGTNWTRYAIATSEIPAGFTLKSVMWDNSLTLYATGDNGSTHIVASSQNGSNWTKEFQGTGTNPGRLLSIAGTSTGIVAVGDSKTVTKP